MHVWNLRLGRDFRMALRRRLEVAIDIYNLPNVNKETGFATGANQDYTANFGKKQGSQSPRSYLASVRYQF